MKRSINTTVINVKYRRPLNEQQVRILHALYWFRFCTSKQLTMIFNASSPKALQNKLKILEDQAFIAKRYDKTYKLAGRPAEYYITPKGARELEKQKPSSTNQLVDRSLYKNKTVSDTFLYHSISIVDVARRLRTLYGKGVLIMPKSYMVGDSFYPRWTPDLHLKIPSQDESPAKHFFVDIWNKTQPFFISVRKVRNYVNYKENGDWDSSELYPAIFAICEDPTTQKKLNRQMKRVLDEAWDDDLLFATTTHLQLSEATKASEKIWAKVDSDGDIKMTSFEQLIQH